MGTEPSIRHCPLRQCAIEQPHLILLKDASQDYSAELLDTWVEQYKQALSEQGLVADDKLVIRVSSPLETILLVLACLRSGIIFCPLNPALPMEKAREYALAIQASGIVGVGITSAYVECFSGCVHFQPPAKATTGKKVVTEILINPERMADLIATSGTTGVPKAVAHSYSNHFYSAMGSQSLLPLTGG